MVYRSLMMGVLLLAMTYFTDPNLLFADMTASGNSLFYGAMSPQKGIEPVTKSAALTVQFDVIPATGWNAALLSYDVIEENDKGGYIDTQKCRENTKHSITRYFIPQNKDTVNMKVTKASCGFQKTGSADETAKEKDSPPIKIN